MEELVRVTLDSSFWAGKRVLVTGHTGFKGSWMSAWLSKMGARLRGYAMSPPSEPNLFEVAHIGTMMDSVTGDVRNIDSLRSAVFEFEPEIVFHLAAQPLVRDSYRDPVTTFSTNVMGTINLFEVLRDVGSARAIINVTTDKVYENKEWDWGYREVDRLGGHDPYSSSKVCAEHIAFSYASSFFESLVGVSSARAGNVIGGGDWGHERLIPDFINAWVAGESLVVRNPKSTRPWQHVLVPLSGYLMLAQRLFESPTDYSGPWNFGPPEADCRPVGSIIERMQGLLSGANWVNEASPAFHEASRLKLDISKAQNGLGWSPVWSIDEALTHTAEWYQAWVENENMANFTMGQITKFERRIKTLGD